MTIKALMEKLGFDRVTVIYNVSHGDHFSLKNDSGFLGTTEVVQHQVKAGRNGSELIVSIH